MAAPLKFLAGLVLGLALGVGASFAFNGGDDSEGTAAAADATAEPTKEAAAHGGGSMGSGSMSSSTPMPHTHVTVDVANPDNAPTVKLEVTKDYKKGVNVRIITTNFTWDGASVGGANVENTGHAHIYVDDVKVARSYGEWYQIENITPGKHEILVTLNANDHAEWAINGKSIQAVYYVDVQ